MWLKVTWIKPWQTSVLTCTYGRQRWTPWRNFSSRLEMFLGPEVFSVRSCHFVEEECVD